MLIWGKGRYRTRLAESTADLDAAQRLRFRAFIAGTGAEDRPDGRDRDEFDEICQHVLIEEAKTDRLVATFRLLPLRSGSEIGHCYSAQYYALEGLKDYQGSMVEMGRFCIEPGLADPNILRSAWAAVTAYVDAEEIEMLFGCSSFHGTDADYYADAFAVLTERYIAPKRWLPRIKAPDVFRFAERFRRPSDRTKALKRMPPLLRSYLTMGGWVSDHAVVDRDLNTLHVFTGLEIKAIPPARARALRAAAG